MFHNTQKLTRCMSLFPSTELIHHSLCMSQHYNISKIIPSKKIKGFHLKYSNTILDNSIKEGIEISCAGPSIMFKVVNMFDMVILAIDFIVLSFMLGHCSDQIWIS